MKFKSMWSWSIAAMLVCAIAGHANAAVTTIDFETDAAGNPILPGQVIDDEYAAWGVIIEARNNLKPFDLAVAFPSENPSTPDDFDLGSGSFAYHPSNTVPQGNVLIIQENNIFTNDGLIETPDDQAGKNTGSLRFYLSGPRAGGGVTFLDTDSDEVRDIQLYLEGNKVTSFRLRGAGDNSVQSVGFGGASYDEVRVYMNGSGSIATFSYGSNVVPEPATAMLAGIGAAVMMIRRRHAA